MPTIIAIDNSLSMSKTVANGKGGTKVSNLQIGCSIASQVVEHFSKSKLEYISILSFSSSVDIVCDFTRNKNQLKTDLSKVEIQDKCCFPTLVKFINDWVVKAWGCMEMFQIIVITDGRIMAKTEDMSSSDNLFDFPTSLHFLCLEISSSLSQSGIKENLDNAISHNNGNGTVLSLFDSNQPVGDLTCTAEKNLNEFLEEKFDTFVADLQCGSLCSKVIVFPSPKFANDDEIKIGSKFRILGFLNISDVGNPPVRSRHLLRPLNEDVDMKEEDESKDSGLQPTFAVVLHGSLKIENKVALVKVAYNWFGIVHSWADTKTRSNLVLSLLPCGFDAVPWMGDIGLLGPENLLSGQAKSGDLPSFPVQTKKGTKRSYAQPTVAWIRATGLQTDVQRILRSAKKLPEKSQVFYKDLNRLRRAALSFGFNELLEGISSLLERECTLLPGTAHPEATLQLSHAARELKSSISLGYKHVLEPLKTDFKFNK